MLLFAARLHLCDKTTGNCVCRVNVEGPFCDRCKVGFYNLSRAHPGGCLPCGCDVKGTTGNTGQCDLRNGTCTCKSLVTGRQCNLCITGTFNLTLSNPEGCTRCNCNPKGTVLGNTTPQCTMLFVFLFKLPSRHNSPKLELRSYNPSFD